MLDLNSTLCGGMAWCGSPVGRLVVYDRDGGVLADVTIPPGCRNGACNDDDDCRSDHGPEAARLVVEKLAGGRVATVKELAAELGYTPDGWFRRVVTGLFKRGRLIRVGRGCYRLNG